MLSDQKQLSHKIFL